MKFSTLGISSFCSGKHVRKHHVIQKEIAFILNSDAHYINLIGEIYTVFNIEEITFQEIKMTLNQKHKRFVQLID